MNEQVAIALSIIAISTATFAGGFVLGQRANTGGYDMGRQIASGMMDEIVERINRPPKSPSLMTEEERRAKEEVDRLLESLSK